MREPMKFTIGMRQVFGAKEVIRQAIGFLTAM